MIRIQTTDARFGRPRVRDELITGAMRINAEPAPEVRPGDMGVRYDGTQVAVPRQIDIDELAEEIVAGVGLLSPADLAKVKEIVRRYGGNPPTRGAGISVSDAVSDARRAVRDAGRSRDAVTSINRANADFWDKRNAAMTAEIYRR
jgi:hypothetical protein